jgi:hypothetical protein
MMLSPRQAVAWLELMDRLDRIDRANQLVTAAIGAQGDKQAIDKMVKELTAS